MNLRPPLLPNFSNLRFMPSLTERARRNALAAVWADASRARAREEAAHSLAASSPPAKPDAS